MPSKILTTPFDGPATWTNETLLEDDGLIVLDADCLHELRRAAATIREDFRDTSPESLAASDFQLQACARLMGEVRLRLDHGVGFAIVDRLPVEALEPDVAPGIYWLLMNLVGRPVAQTHTGTMIYDVTDTNQRTAAGNGVRSSRTNQGQSYHTDNAFNLPPDHVGLLCLHPAAEGGTSGLVSFESVYNQLLESSEPVLDRLYEPFYYDRQFEHPDHEPTVTFKPMIEYDGTNIGFAFNPRLIAQGYEATGQELDERGVTALAVVKRVCETPGMGKRFEFERGQIQIVNNRRLGHRRTAYVDDADPTKRRHLIRIWLRSAGSATYDGVGA